MSLGPFCEEDESLLKHTLNISVLVQSSEKRSGHHLFQNFDPILISELLDHIFLSFYDVHKTKPEEFLVPIKISQYHLLILILFL